MSGNTAFPKFPTLSGLQHKELSPIAVRDVLGDSTDQMNEIRHCSEG